jgi:hypothetical protein
MNEEQVKEIFRKMLTEDVSIQVSTEKFYGSYGDSNSVEVRVRILLDDEVLHSYSDSFSL